jgi:hypothetical protein
MCSRKRRLWPQWVALRLQPLCWRNNSRGWPRDEGGPGPTGGTCQVAVALWLSPNKMNSKLSWEMCFSVRTWQVMWIVLKTDYLWQWAQCCSLWCNLELSAVWGCTCMWERIAQAVSSKEPVEMLLHMHGRESMRCWTLRRYLPHMWPLLAGS